MSYGNSSAFQFYDLNGQRIFKTDSQSDTNFNTQNPAGSLNPSTSGVFYQYDPNGNLLWQQTVGGLSTGFLEHETATHYYWLPNEHGDILIGFDQGINSYAVYTDHLNTPRLVTKIENPQNPKALTDTSNDLPEGNYGEPQGISPLAIPVWQWSYSPFGADLANGYEARPTTIANNFKPELWTWVGLPETGGADPYQVAQETWRIQANLSIPPVLSIRYPGQYYDFETGLVQNWWRTYEPRIGRYTSADPIGLNGGWNRFAYSNQDGINQYDPYGLWVWGDPINQSIVDGAAGFGDGVSFGMTDTISNEFGINDSVNQCSNLYNGSKYAGYAWGVATMWPAGLNGGASSVFWSGTGNMQRAASLGRSLESTPIGALMNQLGGKTPYWMWKAASATYAANARGVAIKVGVQPGTIWRTIEQPILNARKIPIKVVP